MAQFRYVMLEKAKLYFNIGNTKEAIDTVKSLIKKESENAKYWVFLHIFTADDKKSDTSKKALFRAYDIDPTNSLVLNCLIAFYYQSNQFGKFFKAIQLAQKLNYLNPNIISILTLMNAQVALMGEKDMDSAQRNDYLLEAINLAQSYGVASAKSDSLKEYTNDFHMM